MSDDKRTFNLVFNPNTKFEQPYLIEVWCDGREYDPVDECYRPQYSYRIRSREWEYTANDIQGARNEGIDLAAASKSLFAFLIACQEGLPEDVEGKAENADSFPDYVREFAYLLKEELFIEYEKLEREITGQCPDL